MPIVIPKDLPAYAEMQRENVFVMTKLRAETQDIRPIEILILNLMPTKIATETQLVRLLSNSPLQVNPTFINTESYESKNVSAEHLQRFYKTFSEIKNNYYDGMIITGAPVETMPFEDVAYWRELTEIFEFAKTNVTSTIFICWGAQAALNYYYGVEKQALPQKLFGVFPHKKLRLYEPLLKGIDDEFYIPHSRHTTVRKEDVEKIPQLEILATNEKAGVAIIRSRDDKQVFLTGHMEYDRYTLKEEYERDLAKGLDIAAPENYFRDENKTVVKNWSGAANLLFTNWLNYYVYQVTPYDVKR